jgi:hypothetical protein
VNSYTSYTFSLQKCNHYTLLFFGACGKWGGHFGATCGERQLNGEGQISHYNRSVYMQQWGQLLKNIAICGYFLTYLAHAFIQY